MVHDDSTWLRNARAMRRLRLTAPLVSLLACVLLAGLPAAASATAPEMRGEWQLVIKSGPNTIEGTALITAEADGEGKFASHSALFAGVIPGTFSGKLEGATATVKTTTQAFGPVGASEFSSKTMTVESGVGTLKLSGEGELSFAGGGPPAPATLNATRIKTQKQIEEQEAREKREREEREARANIRGEWAITLESGPIVFKGVALITEEANAKNEFASSSALFESFIPGSFSGTLEGGKATVKVTNEAAGPAPAGEFNSTEIVVSTANNPASMSGPGTFTVGGSKSSGQLTATRLRTHQQIEEQEKTEREAKEKAELEAKEKAEREAREKAEREAKEKAEREAKEKRAREEAEKAKPLPLPLPTIVALVSVEPNSKTLTLGHSNTFSLDLTNPNATAVHGHVKLTLAKAGKASAKHTTGPSKSSTLGESSFTISSHGSEILKIKLSSSGRAQLARHKTLRVLVAVTTQATGYTSAGKSYTLTLRAAKAAHGKH
jgi:hypothetical protein